VLGQNAATRAQRAVRVRAAADRRRPWGTSQNDTLGLAAGRTARLAAGIRAVLGAVTVESAV
jgi:hypothetical protein